MTTHSSILAWRIPWTEEPARLQSMGWQRAGHNWSNLAWMPSWLTILLISAVWEFFLKYSFPLEFIAAAAAKSIQSCPTLWDPIEGGPPGFPVSGILQARTLEWVAISFSNAWKGKVKVKSLSRVRLFETPWSAAYQAPPSMGFSRQEYWSGVPLPSP